LFWVILAVGQAPLLGTEPAAAQPGTSLAGSEWRPLEIRSVSVPEPTKLFLKFSGDGKITGFTGCNHFFGGYEIVERTLALSVLGTTRMACADGTTNLEAAFLDALGSTATFERHRVVLVLFDRDGAQTAKFAQTDWD
jgi:putative lipoprotein